MVFLCEEFGLVVQNSVHLPDENLYDWFDMQCIAEQQNNLLILIFHCFSSHKCIIKNYSNAYFCWGCLLLPYNLFLYSRTRYLVSTSSGYDHWAIEKLLNSRLFHPAMTGAKVYSHILPWKTRNAVTTRAVWIAPATFISSLSRMQNNN